LNLQNSSYSLSLLTVSVTDNLPIAANRLIRISDLHPSVGSPAHVSEFTYDGLWRRVEIKEKQGLQTVADRKFVWAGAEIKEERDQSNNVVKRFYGSGVQVVQGPLGGVYLYTRDHLGSVRGVLDGAGNQVAAYDYDVWGNRTQTAGTFVADFGYAGYFEHQPSGLKLTWFRGYSPLLGRWIGRDPMGEQGGINLYAYVQDEPVGLTDYLGLCWYYSQSSGEMTRHTGHDNPEFNMPTFTGYSGDKNHWNNPNSESVPGGVIPQGVYHIDPNLDSALTQPVLKLTPEQVNPYNDPRLLRLQKDNRPFEIHGDNGCRGGCHTSSDGCIILPPDAREQIAASGDHCLVVTK
jgi:RHS repeat-associated protein